MTIPAVLLTELNFVIAQVKDASPLEEATYNEITAIKLNLDELVINVNTALDNAAGQLDTWQAPVDPVAIINGVLTSAMDAEDQNALFRMAALSGRADRNVDILAS